VLVTFALMHTVIILTMVMVTQRGLAAPGAQYHIWVRCSLLAAFAGNVVLLCRNWRLARLQPPSPLVPRRVRNHILLLRASRATVFMALCLSIPLALYFMFLHSPYHSSRAAYAALISAIVGPVVLALKFRWLTVWQRRLHVKAEKAAIAF
jgi:hypothetical protein